MYVLIALLYKYNLNGKYSSTQNNYTTSGVKEPKQPTHNGFVYAYTFNFKIKLRRNNLATSVGEVFGKANQR